MLQNQERSYQGLEREAKMNIREEAERLAVEEFCRDCKGSKKGCEEWDTCDAYQEEVSLIIQDWTAEASLMTEPKRNSDD